MPQAWDGSLHDTFDSKLYGFMKYNFDFHKSYSEFLKRRCKIEDDYAKEIKRLCHDFRPKEFNAKEKITFSLQSSFDCMVTELVSVANQHELLRDELRQSAKKSKEDLAEMRRSEEAVERQIAQLQRSLERRSRQVESARRQFQQAHAEMTRAAEKYRASKDRVDITRLEEERLRDAHIQRSDQCEDKQNSYAKEVSDFNELQRQFYSQQLPEQLARLEGLHAKLCELCAGQFRDWAHAELEMAKISTNCLTSMARHACGVSARSDAELLSRVTVSGNPVPADQQFQAVGCDLSPSATSATSETSDVAASPVVAAVIRPKRLLRSLIGGKSSSLANAPAQRRRLMQEQAKQKKDELAKVEKQIEAAQRMIQCIRDNPSTGSESTVKQQMEDMLEQAKALKDEICQLEMELNSEDSLGLERKPSAPAGSAIGFGDEFDDDEEEEEEADGGVAENGGRPSPSPSPSASSSRSEQPPEPLMVMTYDFDDSSQPDNLKASQGERLRLIRSEPSGWAWVARVDGSEAGFVPANWLEAGGAD